MHAKLTNHVTNKYSNYKFIMSLRVNQSHNNSLICIYFHACTLTQDLIDC